MQSLRDAIATTAAAARKVATGEHVDHVIATLKASLKPFPLLAEHQFDDIPTGPGIYFLDVRFPFTTKRELSDFVAAWGSRGAATLQKSTSRAYPKRAKAHIEKVESGDFVPLYVGKHMDIRSRVRGHLVGKAEQGTYGLKLLSRTALLQGCELRASGVAFPIEPDAYFCVQFLEAGIRERLHPIVGKQ